MSLKGTGEAIVYINKREDNSERRRKPTSIICRLAFTSKSNKREDNSERRRKHVENWKPYDANGDKREDNSERRRKLF